MINDLVPTEFYLGQNYPNPFKDETIIKYCVADKTRIQITVYNSDGAEIEKLVDEVKEPGTYEVQFSASHSRNYAAGGKNIPAEKRGLPDAYYYYRMTAGNYISEKKWLCINKLSERFNMKNLLQFLFFFLSVSNSIAQQSDHIIEHNYAKIHYSIIGTGKPILFLSGGPGFSSEYMVPIAELLSNSFQCILLDQRGTGKSLTQNYDTTLINISATIEDIEFLRKHLLYDEWILLGHSYGGLLASKYASVYPNSIVKIILVGTAGFNTSLWDYFGDNIWSRLLPSDKELAEYWNDSIIVANDFNRAMFEYQKAIMPAYFCDRKNSLLFTQKMKPEDWNIDVWKLIWRDMMKIDLSEISQSFNKPVLVMHGRQDPVGELIPFVVSQTYPNSKLVFIEQCGHLPWLEQPEVFRDALISFLNKH